jgi:hypothetical protein
MDETPDTAKYSDSPLGAFLRAAELHEDSNRSLRALLQAAELYLECVKTYGEAKTTAEREARFERLRAAIKKNQPELIQELAAAGQSGLYLLMMFYYARESISNRKDLSQAVMEGADSEAQEFLSMFNAVRDARGGVVPRELVFRFSMVALSIGLGAGLNPEELCKLQAKRQMELSLKGVEARLVKIKWHTRAEELAIAAFERQPEAKNADIVRAIRGGWKLDERRCPTDRTLSTFVTKLRNCGKLRK